MSNSTGAVQDAPSAPTDPAVTAALETFTAATSKQDLYEAFFSYLDDPKTPHVVRLLIGQIINAADKLAAGQLVVA